MPPKTPPLQFAKSLRPIWVGNRVRVDTNDPRLNGQLGITLARAAIAAYRFDLNLGVHSRVLSLQERPIDIHLVTPEKLRSLAPGASAFCLGSKDLFMNSARELDDNFESGLAHELSHAKSARLGGGFPSFFEEAQAGLRQIQYGFEQLEFEHPSIPRFAKRLCNLTAPEAKKLIENMWGAKPHSDRGVGEFFIEFMRLHFCDSDGKRLHFRLDSMRQRIALARTNEPFPKAMATKKRLFESAFEAEFGISLGKSTQEFLQHLRLTQDRPQLRLANTIWRQTQAIS